MATYSEFKAISTWHDLEQFCYVYGLDTCEYVYNDDDIFRYITDHSYSWQDLQNFTGDLSSSDRYVVSDYDGILCSDDGDSLFIEYKDYAEESYLDYNDWDEDEEVYITKQETETMSISDLENILSI